MSKSDLDALPKLKPAIKKRWLKALRSGEYAQTTGLLRDASGYCCLGVLCDVVKNDKAVKLEWKELVAGNFVFDYCDTHLPGVVEDYVVVARGPDDDAFGPLINRNDDGQTFKQIANIIERHM